MEHNDKLLNSADFIDARKKTIISLMKSGIRPDYLCGLKFDDIFKIYGKYFVCLFDGKNKNSETIFIRVKTKELSKYIRLWQSLPSDSKDKPLVGVGRTYMYDLYKDHFKKKQSSMTFAKFAELENTIGANMPDDQFFIYLTEKNYEQRKKYFKSKIEDEKKDIKTMQKNKEEQNNCEIEIRKAKVSKALFDKICGLVDGYCTDTKEKTLVSRKWELQNLERTRYGEQKHRLEKRLNQIAELKNLIDNSHLEVIPFKILIGVAPGLCKCGHYQISLFAFIFPEEKNKLDFTPVSPEVQSLISPKCSECQKPLYTIGDPSIWDFFF